MLTYRALESNSVAVACDVAGYLRGASVDFNAQTPGECALNGASTATASVIVAPFDSSAFENFRVWRSEMMLMRELHDRAQPLCPEAGRGLAKQLAQSALSAAIPGGGSLLSLAQGLLGIGAANPGTVTPVGGTIQDQAFMDAVARQLHRLHIVVLMPSTYAPFDISAPAAQESPFVSGVMQLLDLRACLVRQEAGDLAKDPDATNVRQLVGDIDAYVGALQGFGASPVSDATPGSPAGRDLSGKKADAGAVSVSVWSAPPTLLLAVLSGDGFAQELGVSPTTGLLAIDENSPHVLLVKALESGGSVATSRGGMLRKSETHYSGGAVGTFAMFRLNGELECSGNVYDYGDSGDSGNFAQGMRAYQPAPAKQYIFQQGSCQRAAGQ